ncbi:hypothetical protein [Burkholderia gladioli]|uniref:hypothetical protein n=1 Tax=Burkholderia gladioli TaxID=28095 RepID=UPI00163EE666|nr:hypothetical protein [Burkholderia gladioli]
MNGLDLIAAEITQRRVLGKVDTKSIDDGQMAMAAACYAAPQQLYRLDGEDDDCVMSDPWPWARQDDDRHAVGERRHCRGRLPADPETCTVEERIELLAKAGAMIALEINRLLKEVPVQAELRTQDLDLAAA